jgi:hypothetical protein
VLSAVLFLFLTHLGIGVLWTLLLVKREAGVKFFRFNAGLAAILLVSGIFFRPAPPFAAGDGLAVSVGLGVALAASTIYWATVGRRFGWLNPWLLRAAALAGVVAIVGQGASAAFGSSGLARILTVASFLSSAALLGGACTAMILGHWYLILPSLDVAHLQQMVRFHLGSLVVRVVLVVLVAVLAIRGILATAGVDLVGYATSIAGVFLWQRVLFGLAGPAALGWLTWETAKIKSTQSATGILYVDLFTVIVGEVLAKYLLMETSLPL